MYLVPGGVLSPRGACLVPGGCVWPGGHAWSRGACLVQGVSGPGACLVWGGVWSRGHVWSGGRVWSWGCVSGPGGCLVLGGVPGQVLPPVNRMTHRCKNITLAKTSFRPVKIFFSIDVHGDSCCLFVHKNNPPPPAFWIDIRDSKQKEMNKNNNIYYCPQRSWGKVMFLHVSVILFTGGGGIPAHIAGGIPACLAGLQAHTRGGS